MRLVRLLNVSHHFPGFVYDGAKLDEASNTIEIQVRPRQGCKAICSGCGKRAAGYDQLPERGFEFIPMWGFYGVLTVQHEAGGVRAVRGGEGRARALGDGQAHPQLGVHAVSGAVGA